LTGTSTVTANQYYRLRIYSTVAGTVNFQLLDNTGVSLATSACASGVPTVTTLVPQFILVTDTAASKAIGIDHFSFKQTGLSR
jgi:hypothetical protein